jgi:phosphotriesterase-related protein
MRVGTVETIRGPVDTAALGTTYMHEHVFVLSPELISNYPETWDEQARVAEAVAKLTELKGLGVDTIVDPTVIGLGRDVARVARVNAEVDINIVAATGIYTYDSAPFPFHYVGPNTLLGGDEPMIGMFVRDITKGIADTGIKAAFLKCAIDSHGLTPDIERILRAVARAHRLTGVPITVHTAVANRSGREAQRVLREEGVDLSRVVMGHVGDTTDLDYLRELADTGAFLGMDRFGIDLLLPFEDRVATVAKLVAEGYTDQLVLAHDASCHSDWFPPGVLDQAAPRWHFRHITEEVLPALREQGVSDQQISTMLVDNPRRYFEHVDAY